MRMKDAAILWDKKTKRCAVVEHPDDRPEMPQSHGACVGYVHGFTGAKLTAYVFVMFNKLVREGIPVELVHEEFLKINEYARAVDAPSSLI